MIYFQIFLFIFIQAVICPFSYGIVLNFFLKDSGRSYGWKEIYVTGLISELAIFQLMCVPFTIFKLSLTALSCIYGGLSLLIFVGSLYIQKKENYRFLKQLQGAFRNNGILEWAILILIVIQTAYSAVFATYEVTADDATYIVQSVGAVDTDSLFLYEDSTGEQIGLERVAKLAVTSITMFFAYLSKVSGIHAAIIMHTIIPLWFIPSAYIIYGILGDVIFKENKRKGEIFLLLLSFINIFGVFSVYCQAFRLLVCIWHGKAVVAVMLLPYTLTLMLRAHDEGINKRCVVCLLMTGMASAGASVLGDLLFPALLFLMSFVCFFIKKDKHFIYLAFGCSIPAIIYLGTYYILNGFLIGT